MSGTTSSVNPAQTVLSGATLATPTVSYYVYPADQTVQGFESTYTTQAWNAYQLQQLALAFQAISNVTNLTFTQATNLAGATFAIGLSSTLGPNPIDPDLLGFFSFPSPGTPQLGMFNASGQGFGAAPGQGLDQGGYGFITLIHELGHGVGLKHPFDGGATDTNPILPGVVPLGGSEYSLGDFALNQGLNTMMSYNNGWQTGPLGPAPAGQDFGFEGTPMAFDIAALQSMYGANTSYHAGDDTYVLPGSNGPGTAYSAIWDAGGTNTIAYSGSGNAVINLNAASLVEGPNAGGAVSYVQGVNGGYTIAHGVTIQRAISGSGNDFITGNNGNDYLNAGTGSNVIVSGTGINTIISEGTDLIGTSGTDDVFLQGPTAAVFSGGNDTIVGGAGNAIIGVNGASNADAVFGGAGTLAFINGNAASAVVRGTGTAAIFGGAGGGIYAGGTAGNNTLIAGTGRAVLYGSGNGDTLYAAGTQGDVLIGGSGNETLVGGYSAGNDVFYTGSGTDLIGLGAGQDVVFGGSGISSVLGGSSSNDLFAFVNGRAGGTETISNFGGNDKITLQGYGSGAIASTLASAKSSGGSVTVTLPDATTLTLIGPSSINASAFV